MIPHLCANVSLSHREIKLMSEEMHAQIVRAWEVLFQPDQIVELRAPKAGRNKTISGYFDNADALIKAVLPWDGKVNLYVTLNPINPALLARSTNKAKSYAETTTADKDIIRLRWLLIDFDAVRPAGISATDAEHQAALQQAA